MKPQMNFTIQDPMEAICSIVLDLLSSHRHESVR